MRITGKPGLITSLVGYDNISGIPDGTYDLVDNATGTGATVTMSGGAIASFTPGSGYSLGDVYASGYGNRFTVASIAPSGTRITGGLRVTGPATGPTLYTPTGTPSQYFAGAGDFEMGVWNPSDPANVVDISGNNHSMGFNDQTYSGNVNYAHFLNNSAQANDVTWPTVPGSTLAITGWFAFAGFNSGSTSMVTRTNGGPNGWAFRVDYSGTQVNLVKYGADDQSITLNTPLTTNTWHYISVAQNGTSVVFNIDGTAYSRSGNPAPFNDDGGGAPVRLQYDPYTGGNQNIEMWMRDVKIISSNALDAAALLALWNIQKGDYGY